MATVSEFVVVGKAIGDPTRVRILSVLAVRELCVTKLVSLMDLRQPAVSRHLGILRDAGLVEDVRRGKFVYYRLKRPAPSAFAESVVQGLIDCQKGDPDFRELRRAARRADCHP